MKEVGHPTFISRRALLGGACMSALASAGCASLGQSSGRELQNWQWADADAIVAAIARPVIPARRFMVALPVGTIDARPAILDAINTATLVGGGRVIVPEGVWNVDGPIHLKSSIELHLSAGCELKFSGNHAKYLPVVFTRWEGTECWNYSPLIYARGQSNIAITGSGTINGQGAANWLPWRRDQRPDQTRLRDMGRDGVPVSERIFGEGKKLRPPMVQFLECSRVLLEGVTLRDSPFWCVHPVYCSDVIVRNITIVSKHINSDGVDPDSSQRVLIENCIFEVGDDGVALKAGRDQDGWRVGKACQDIVVRNCKYLGDTGGGLAIGSEMSGGVRDVFVDGWDIPKASHALYFKANLDRGGFIENVRIRNIRCGDVRALIKFTNDYHSYRGGNFPTRFRAITIEDVVCDKAEVGLHISGDARAPIEDIVIRNLVLRQATAPLQIANVGQVQLDDVRMNGQLVREATPSAKETWLKLPN